MQKIVLVIFAMVGLLVTACDHAEGQARKYEDTSYNPDGGTDTGSDTDTGSGTDTGSTTDTLSDAGPG